MHTAALVQMCNIAQPIMNHIMEKNGLPNTQQTKQTGPTRHSSISQGNLGTSHSPL